MQERKFPSPYEVETPPGCEGWQRLYPYHYLFSEERRDYEEKQLWYWDSLHYPYPVKPLEMLSPVIWQMNLSEYNSRVFCVPVANGISHRILNGYLYISANAVEDPAVVSEREPLFTKRAGYYYEHWDELFEKWVSKVTTLIKQVEEFPFNELPLYEDEKPVLEGRGYWSGYLLLETWDKLKRSLWKAWEYHFEFLNLTYAAYVTFYQFCERAFPQIPKQVIPRMIAGGAELTMLRPQEELAKLARLAMELGVGSVLKHETDVDRLFEKLKATETGRKWIEAFEKAKDPWFYTSTGTGFYFSETRWIDDLSIPLGYIRDYVEKLEKGGKIERDKEAVVRQRDELVEEYTNLLETEEDKKAFHELHQLMLKTFPYAETHIFYIEHWFHGVWVKKLRELAKILVNAGFFPDVNDILYFSSHEVEVMLEDLVDSWGVGPGIPTRGERGYWRKELQWRKELFSRLREYTPPPAVGSVPDKITEPFTIQLWGITDETIKAWLGAGAEAGETGELRGFAASKGVVEGAARVVLDVAQIAEVQEGEILVAPITSPSWATVFHKVRGVVTDLGGISSHAAIVAREFGIPCVTGTGYATRTIKTGDLVRVDGETGTVVILKSTEKGAGATA